MVKLRHFTLFFAALCALALGAPPKASAYNLIVVGDTNLFPFDTANPGDIGGMVDCYNGLAVCPPGCNQNLFPFDTCNAGDIGFMVDYLNGGPLSFFPGGGYVNFTSDPGNPPSPVAGTNSFGVIVDMVSTATNLSGFDNVKGVLGVRAEIIADVGGGASITPPAAALAPSGPGLQVGTGSKAQGAASVDLTCGADGDVTIRFYVPAYSHIVGAGEHCAGGAACAPGEHMDQIDIVVTCGGGPVDPCTAPLPDGTVCGRVPSECDGGETCLAGACTDNGFVAAGSACGDTGVECLVDDTCDGAGACTDNGLEADGTACGDPSVTSCDLADQCLAGVCDANPAPAGSACGDTGVECLVDDTCDGAGACTDNGLEADGTACGDPSVTECDLADTCSAGACVVNNVAAGSACGDTGVECLVNDTCDGAGACTDNGLEPDGTACGDPSVTSCDLADQCLAGVCDANPVGAGAPCGDQGVECLVDDTCDGAGACADNGFEPAATACGDPSNTECTNPDSCDGGGVCLPNDEAAGFACGDQGVECLVNDSCDGGGTCVDAGLEADGTACGDPSVTQCDLADTCAAGSCVANPVAAGSPCGDTGVECLVDDTCDGAGACTDNGNVADGTSCTDDLLFCSGPETCTAGLCTSDGDPCAPAPCDEGLDACIGEICNDGIDNDGDLLADCADPDCPDGSGCLGNGAGECSAADTCLAGVCEDNDLGAGSACGDTGVECLVNDTCDGAGVCTDNGFDDGASCTTGNGVSACSAADTCSAGACLDNDLAAGSACGDTGVECLVDDTCDGAGTCTDNGLEADGTACGDPSVTECDLADTCTAGACVANPVAAGSACGDTGVECLVDDTCDGAGLCTDNGFEAAATPCGDPSNTECTNPDTCDGGGTCLVNDEAAGFACGDQGVDCLVNDACDGAGACTDNGLEPDGTLCTDNGAFCDGVEECATGSCISPGDPCAPDGCDEVGDQCLVATCDGVPLTAVPCTADIDCTDVATGGVCPADTVGDCMDNVCVGGGAESEIGICSEQPGLADAVCLATTCSADSLAEGTSVGGDCVTRNDAAHSFGVTFNTNATSGTLFTVWARILLDTDWDAGEQYDCSIDGVTGLGTVNWSYTETGLVGGANGPGCAAGTADGDMCWAAANDNVQIALDAGAHVFTCTANTNANTESTGFDGLIFTTNAAYIPDFQDTACGDDASFQAGTCFGNWGPSNYSPGAGYCTAGEPGDLGDTCRPDAGECDVPETCDGVVASCPADGTEPDGTVCGVFGVECDLDDTCLAGACVDNGSAAAATPCGDPTDTECLNPDICDGAGACLPNDPAAGAPCGDQGVECLANDACDGLGVCVDAGFDDGAPCAGNGAGECSAADTCLSGLCEDNDFVIGSACGDTGVECLVDDTCDGAGVCTDNGPEAAGTACGDPSNTDCTNPDTCDGGGACAINDEADGFPCTDDGQPCSDDQCLAGVCNHPPTAAGTECNASTGECDPAENCDGIALTCPADVFTPDFTPCTDNGAFCDGNESCLTGVCTPEGDPCTPNGCDEVGDVCIIGGCTADPGTVGWVYDPANLGQGDMACFEFTAITSGNPDCITGSGTVAAVAGSTANIWCCPAATLTADLPDPATCGTFTSSTQRLANIEISCDNGGAPITSGSTPAGYAMLTTDGIGGVGDGNNEGTVDICAIDRWTFGNHAYTTGVQIDQATLGTITGTIAGGAGCTTIAGVEPGAITVTCASDGFQTVTYDKVNSRTIVCAMDERAPTYENNRPVEWILSGNFNAASYNSIYGTAGPRHGACDGNLAPNPIRGGLTIIGLYRSGFANLSLDSLIGASVAKDLDICAGGLTLTTDLPGNLASPDIMGNASRTLFTDLRTRKAGTTVLQAVGVGLSPEGLNIDDLLAGADISFLAFDLVTMGQEIVVFDTVGFCGGGGGACNVNPLAANGGSYNVGHMPDYGHIFGNKWEYHGYDWTAQDVNIMYDITQGPVQYGADVWGAADGPNQTANLGDNDPIRYGPDAFFGCPGDPPAANCYSNGGAGREAQGFLARETYWSGGGGRGVALRDGLNIYGMFVDAGTLQDHLLAIALNIGGKVECPGGNGTGNQCYGFGALGGPLPSSAAAYVNGRYPGAITAYRGGTMSTWFKFEARASVQIQIHPDGDFGAVGCTNAYGPRTGSCLESATTTNEMIGLPYGVQNGVSPTDMGASASVDACKATNCGIAPGGCDACPADGGDVRNLGVQARTFSWNANAPTGLSGNFNRSPIIGRHNLSVSSAGDCLDATGTPIVGIGCGDDSWTVITAGPGFTGGADVTFTLPDISAMPGAADWRFIEPGSAGAPGDLGAGFHQLDGQTCTGGDCPGQANGGAYSSMGWTIFGMGNQSLNSCTTVNAYHFTEVGAGGVGGIYESQSFANNTMETIWNDN